MTNGEREWFTLSVTPAKAGVQVLDSRFRGNDEARAGIRKRMITAPTIDLARASRTEWDAVVVGAGPAGAFAALKLARAGRATLLVERKSFPRPKVCGGCLNAHALAALGRAGLIETLRGCGAQPVSTVHLRHRGRAVQLPIPAGLAVSRAVLDAMIVGAAIDAGCAFLPETTALLVPEAGAPWREGWRRLDVQHHHHRARVASRMVMIADGLAHSSLRECPELRSRVSSTSRIGVGGLADRAIAGATPGAITMAVGRHGYVGITLVEQGRTNIAAALDAGFLKLQANPARAVSSILSEAGIPHDSGALDEVDWQGTVPLTRHMPRPVARRVFVLGDAAGYVEPFTGEGMAWAFAAVEIVVPLATRGILAWDAAIERDWLSAYRGLVATDQRWCRAVSRVLRSSWATRAIVGALSPFPGLARPLLAHMTPARQTNC